MRKIRLVFRPIAERAGAEAVKTQIICSTIETAIKRMHPAFQAAPNSCWRLYHGASRIAGAFPAPLLRRAYQLRRSRRHPHHPINLRHTLRAVAVGIYLIARQLFHELLRSRLLLLNACRLLAVRLLEQLP